MRRWIVVGLLSLGIMLASAGTALATHCYVADKPDGAGTNGAFQREEGDPVDTFQWDLPDPPTRAVARPTASSNSRSRANLLRGGSLYVLAVQLLRTAGRISPPKLGYAT